MRCLIKTFNDGAIINGVMLAAKTKEEIELLFASCKTLPVTLPDYSETKKHPYDKISVFEKDTIGIIEDIEIVETDIDGIGGNKVIQLFGNFKTIGQYKEVIDEEDKLEFKMRSIGIHTDENIYKPQRIVAFDLANWGLWD